MDDDQDGKRQSRRPPSKPDYVVGYGKPPAEHRFPPGKSGNPRGRPKKPKTAKDLFRLVAKMPVKVSQNGRTRKIPTEQAVFQRLRMEALEGASWAIKVWIALCREVDPEGTREGFADLFAEDERLLYELQSKLNGSDQPMNDDDVTG